MQEKKSAFTHLNLVIVNNIKLVQELQRNEIEINSYRGLKNS